MPNLSLHRATVNTVAQHDRRVQPWVVVGQGSLCGAFFNPASRTNTGSARVAGLLLGAVWWCGVCGALVLLVVVCSLLAWGGVATYLVAWLEATWGGGLRF